MLPLEEELDYGAVTATVGVNAFAFFE